MSIFKSIGDTLATLFSSAPIEEKAARIAIDPRVSEPVFMMLQSMKRDPRRWRVVLNLPSFEDYSRGGVRRSIHNSSTPVEVKIIDRNVNETYHAIILVDSREMTELIMNQAMHRVEMAGYPATLTSYPEWLNPQEARELHHALCMLMTKRTCKIAARQNREKDRREKDAKVRHQMRMDQERQRLINVYGAQHDK